MLPIDKYGTMYLAMTGAVTNPELQEQICKQHSVSLAEWNEANAHYTAKMSDVNDMGQTAMALARYMMPQPVVEDDSPVDFTAVEVRIYVSELDVQMVEFVNGNKHVVLQSTVHVNSNDEFLMNYVQGRVHISINDQGYSIYGGVTKVELSRDKLAFHFDDEGKERMKRDMLTVSFNISNPKFIYLERTLYYMYRQHPVLNLTRPPRETKEVWNGIDYDLSWDSFTLNDDFRINLRPSIDHLRETGKYNQHVIITCKNEGVSEELFESFCNEMIATFESDYETIVSMVIYRQESNQMYLYTQLSQQDFMKRVNEALCYIPQLPLNFSGENDPTWNNYMNCRKDYLEKKNN